MKYYKGISGKLYDCNKYLNHGYGGIMYGKLDFPKEDYPYTIVTVSTKMI